MTRNRSRLFDLFVQMQRRSEERMGAEHVSNWARVHIGSVSRGRITTQLIMVIISIITMVMKTHDND